jgi:hypothetical protein
VKLIDLDFEEFPHAPDATPYLSSYEIHFSVVKNYPDTSAAISRNVLRTTDVFWAVRIVDSYVHNGLLYFIVCLSGKVLFLSVIGKSKVHVTVSDTRSVIQETLRVGVRHLAAAGATEDDNTSEATIPSKILCN